MFQMSSPIKKYSTNPENEHWRPTNSEELLLLPYSKTFRKGLEIAETNT